MSTKAIAAQVKAVLSEAIPIARKAIPRMRKPPESLRLFWFIIFVKLPMKVVWKFKRAHIFYSTRPITATKCAAAAIKTKICQISWKPKTPGTKLNIFVAYTTAPKV